MKTVKKAANLIIKKYYTRLALDTNLRICEEIASFLANSYELDCWVSVLIDLQVLVAAQPAQLTAGKWPCNDLFWLGNNPK